MNERQFGLVKISNIYLILLGMLFIYNTSTFLRLDFNFYLDVIMYTSFVILTMAQGYYWRVLNSPMVLWFILSVTTILNFWLNGVQTVWMTYLAGYIHIFFWTAASVFIVDNYSISDIKKYVVIQTVCLGICEVATIRVLALYPLATRGMYGYADGITNTELLHKMGCGGFGFIYGLVFITLGFASIISSQINGPRYKCFAIIAVILAIYTVLFAGFSTAIILMIAGLIGCILYANNNHKWGFLAVILIGFVAAVYAKDIVSVVQTIAYRLGIDIVSEKMGKIIYAFDTENLLSLTRFQVFGISLNGFLNNPIWGSGIAGTDSQLLDIFSYIGIFAISYVGLLLSAFSELRKIVPSRYIGTIQVISFLLAILNPFNDMTLMSIIFGFVPLIVFTSIRETE